MSVFSVSTGSMRAPISYLSDLNNATKTDSPGSALEAAAGGIRHRRTAAYAADPGQRAARAEGRPTVSSRRPTSRSRSPRRRAGRRARRQAVTVGARKLLDILRALPDEPTLTSTPPAARCTVRAGKRRFNLQTLPAEDFRASAWARTSCRPYVPQKTLRGLLKLGPIRDGGAGHPLLPQRHAVRIDKANAACGGHRRPPACVAQIAIARRYRQQEVILPRKTVLELGKLLADSDDPVTIDMLANQARFSFGESSSSTQARRRQVSGLQPRHPERTTRSPSSWLAPQLLAGAAARGDPDEREVPGRARSCSRPAS